MSETKPFSMLKYRTLFYGAATMVLVAACAAPSALAAVTDPEPVRLSPPEPTGPYAIGQVDLHLVDEGRQHPWAGGEADRELMATVWYPAGGGGEPAPYISEAMAGYLATQGEQAGLPRHAVDFAGSHSHALSGAEVVSGAASLPVVLYSPGFTVVSRHQATAQVEELASHGYAVVAMDHPYETMAVEFPDGRVIRERIPTPSELEADERHRQATAVRVADAQLVLDSLTEIAEGGNPDAGERPLPRGLAGALDLSTVGMFGHSLGGLTSAEAMLDDERIDAGVNLDGSIAYHVGDEEWAEVTTRGLDRPFMIFGAGRSGPENSPHNSEHAPDWRLFREASTGDSLEFYMAEGEHMSFIDFQWLLPRVEEEWDPGQRWEEMMADAIGPVDPDRGVRAQRAYLLAFFDEYLRGQERPLLDGPSSEHPDVEFIE